MAKTLYKIVAILLSMEEKHDNFWVKGKKVAEDGTPLHSSMLAETIFGTLSIVVKLSRLC